MKYGFSREHEKHSSEKHKTKWVTVTDMAWAVEFKAGLNADPMGEFVIQGEKRGTGHEYSWTCKCCDGKFTGYKHKLTMHIVTRVAHTCTCI